jgi:O-methyltransferase domain
MTVSAPTKHDFDSLRVEIVGFIRTQLVAAAATLRLAEHLRDGGLQAEDFAACTGLDPTIAFRFLRACAKIDLVTCRDGRLFHATSRLRALDGDTPGSLRHLAMLFGTPSQFLLQTALADALSSPAARNAKGLGVPIFDYYADHPDEAEIFRATMQTSTLGVTDGIVRSLDMTPFEYAVDVGGADGALLHSLMKLNSKLRGAVLERAEVANAAAAAAADRGVADRAEALAGDFFEEAPAADLYLLRFILHDWHDAKAVQILTNCRRSMKANGRLIVIEAFLPEVGEDAPPTMLDTQAPLIDLHMLVATDGRERSLSEYDGLFGKAGLRRIRTTPLDNGYVVIETTAA